MNCTCVLQDLELENNQLTGSLSADWRLPDSLQVGIGYSNKRVGG